MAVPVSQMWAVAKHVLVNKIKGNKRYPLILMLEPLYRCNLACAGCGKIQYPAHILKKNLSFEDAMRAVDECNTPIVSIPGGEPLMHPEIDKIVEGLVARGKYVYLCTNALLLKQKLDLFKPSKFLTFSVHMDGDCEEHDFSVCREGTYVEAEEAIKLAVGRGFRVTTNSTFFESHDVEHTRNFFDKMMAAGVEGMMISPGYSYSKAPNQNDFLTREKTFNFFRKILSNPKKHWRFSQSPLFLEFLLGKRHFECTPWGNTTFSVFGWQKPCYLLQEGYTKTFKELIDDTKWENYGRASGNPQCQNCMVHCGYEASAVDYTFSSFAGIWANIKAIALGVSAERGKNITPPPVNRTVETGVRVNVHENPMMPQLIDAVDYRGDVTLSLKNGERYEGYVFNVTDTSVEFYLKNDSEKHCVFISDLVGVEKTGRDTASGKTWENWVKKFNARKEALARGEVVGDIEPKPENLDD